MPATEGLLPRGAVTGIAPDPRYPAAVRIWVDGRLTWTVAREAAEELGVAPGTLVDPPLGGALAAAADAEAAWRAVLRHVERRPFARGDLDRRLRLKNHPPEAVAAALDRAEAAALVDDGRFARDYVETRAARGRGPDRLRADLARRCVAPVLVEQAIAAQWPDGQGVDDMVRALATRRAAQLAGLPRDARRRRLQAYLARRGFSGGAVRRVVVELTG